MRKPLTWAIALSAALTGTQNSGFAQTPLGVTCENRTLKDAAGNPVKGTDGNDVQLPFCKQTDNALKGLHWGVGILYSASYGGVGDVKLIDSGNGSKVVRIGKESSSAARAAFELHYFLKDYALFGDPSTRWAVGPFISLNSKPIDNLSGSVFNSVGAGIMFGASAAKGDVSHSVNLGLGWMVDTDVKALAPGVVNGQASTLAEDKLTVSKTSSGFMALLSYNFVLN